VVVSRIIAAMIDDMPDEDEPDEDNELEDSWAIRFRR
jgi:hypothetical protein